MELIQLLNDTLGLSNVDIANYLAVSRSHLSMIESKKRQLPSEANLALLKLYTALENISKPELPTQQEKDSFQQALHVLLQAEEYQKIIAEQALQKMQLKYQQAINTIALVNAIQPSNLSGREVACLAALKAKATKKLTENNWMQQQLLSLKIKTITYKITEINKLKQ